MFTVYTLASSSKGNSVYIRMDDTEILVDAGISCKRVKDALTSIDTDISRIDAIFVTHEHSDHVSGLETIAKKYKTPIHMTEPSARAYLRSERTKFTAEAAVIHPVIFTETVGNVTVRSFATPHDSAASVGYVISDGTNTVAVATDMGHVTDEVSDALMGCENVVLESNHDENMLLCGSYPYELKRRILSPYGHLSNESAAAFVSRLVKGGARRILLAHLSEENNLPELAYHEALSAITDSGVFVGVASPAMPTRLV